MIPAKIVQVIVQSNLFGEYIYIYIYAFMQLDPTRQLKFSFESPEYGY